MALLQVNFLSQSLFRTVPLQVILPVDRMNYLGTTIGEVKPFKTLYLLHGLLGNYTDWISGTRIQRWAEEKNLAVVMPSGDNGFYVDRPASKNMYGEFIGQELVDITRRMFPLSGKREDTFIAGLSMGGFGAIRNGLKYHETFGAIIGLSSAVHIFEEMENIEESYIDLLESCFGNIKDEALGDKNPRVLVEGISEKIKQGKDIKFPKIYMACGTEDHLIDANRTLRDFFIDKGIDLTYVEGPGKHDWNYWDEYIKKALDWLALED